MVETGTAASSSSELCSLHPSFDVSFSAVFLASDRYASLQTSSHNSSLQLSGSSKVKQVLRSLSAEMN